MEHHIRVIPCLLLRHWGIEKSIRFKDFVYVGSPINAARMFNAYMSDELILLDIVATKEGRSARPEILEQIADEVSMPLVVGGGIRHKDDVPPLMEAGADRIAINTGAWENKDLITQIADQYGRQCVVVSIDAKRHHDGQYEVVTHAGHQPIGVDPVTWAKGAVQRGAGEILLNSIDRDGTLEGYDIDLFKQVTGAVDVPVVGMGGAANLADMKQAVEQGGVSAVAAGGMFLFWGPRRTVLIHYPTYEELCEEFDRHQVRPRVPFNPWDVLPELRPAEGPA
ncbi:imidazole glycerol phosphate synthase subunit HisF [bacterium]|jgi:imidazole glycerol-phosphate synthase subunit HisF|nr:imidazole glycerol phosphate synthase subunit HisF [bacterium]